MAGKHTCPSCNAHDSKRIGDLAQETTSQDSATKIPDQLKPPKQPWAYVQGFFLAVPVQAVLMLSLGSPEGTESSNALADLAGTLGFLGVWAGYGIWKTKSYTKAREIWKDSIASKLLCLRCGHAFEG